MHMQLREQACSCLVSNHTCKPLLHVSSCSCTKQELHSTCRQQAQQHQKLLYTLAGVQLLCLLLLCAHPCWCCPSCSMRWGHLVQQPALPCSQQLPRPTCTVSSAASHQAKYVGSQHATCGASRCELLVDLRAQHYVLLDSCTAQRPQTPSSTTLATVIDLRRLDIHLTYASHICLTRVPPALPLCPRTHNVLIHHTASHLQTKPSPAECLQRHPSAFGNRT